MNKLEYLSLQPTEQALTVAASSIYAAYVASGQVQNDAEVWIDRAVSEAILIGKKVDDRVVVPGEMS